MMNNASLCLDNVSFAYKNTANILNSLTLTLRQGTITALVGENGCGKTTLIKLLTGINIPTKGRLSYKGLALTQLAYRQQLGYMPENLVLYPQEKVCDVLTYLTRLRQLNVDIEPTLKQVGLFLHKDKKVSALSKGLKQRLNLAQAIIHQPNIAIFDEPSNGFDYLGVSMFYDIIRKLAKQGAIIIITSHLFAELVGNVDQFLLLNKGRIQKTIPGDQAVHLNLDQFLQDDYHGV